MKVWFKVWDDYSYKPFISLMTQSKPSVLQDLNITRLVQYIKKALEQY